MTKAHALAEQFGLKVICYREPDGTFIRDLVNVHDLDQAKQFTDLGCPSRTYRPAQWMQPERWAWEISLPREEV